MGKVQYIKCPRCELNYIKSSEKLCDVCQAELSRKLGTSEEEDDDMILCPVCNKNYIYMEEEMCEQCASEAEKVDAVVVPDIERDEDWRAYLDDDKDIGIPADEMEISLSELETEEEEVSDEDVLEEDIVDVMDDLDE